MVKGKIIPTNKKLLKTLTDMAKLMDEKSLKLLINQAEMIRYNMQIDEINNKRNEMKDKNPINTYSPPQNKTSLEIVEAEDDSHFILVINRERNFFSLEEMRKLVKLCHVASDEKDGVSRLFNWFTKNRMDVINNTEIDGVNDLALVTIYNGIVTRYKPKE